MKLKVSIIIVFLLTFLTTFGQHNSPFQLTEEHKISVVGVGTVSVFPNAAHVTIMIKFLKPRLRDAINENQSTAVEVLKVLKKYVDDTTEIKVSLISTDKSMRWDNTLKKEVFVGFESSQRIVFTLEDLAQMQNFTEDIFKTRIYEIETVSYFHTDASSYLKKAQELAVAEALETTARLSKAGNLKTGKIIFLETNNSPATAYNNVVSSYSLQTYNKSMGGAGVTSSGQLINYTVSVTMFTAIE